MVTVVLLAWVKHKQPATRQGSPEAEWLEMVEAGFADLIFSMQPGEVKEKRCFPKDKVRVNRTVIELD
ncbi:hypothetical protein [Arthrobacter mobilis]|uniref:Uncharacterized protein n=1 Tax=Arthrobacter mobilis TaxID=2724944 RepID=A0A7X6HE23_9MICC|nr:hypothetical protein [Arthrobacter mobilis]NKX54735.1 hypothetical protein [Arthrobacter mobilis]